MNSHATTSSYSLTGAGATVARVHAENAAEIAHAAWIELRRQLRNLGQFDGRWNPADPLQTSEPSHPIDNRLDEVIARHVRARDPNAVYISEESDDGKGHLPPGTIVYRVDAVDGTINARGLLRGYATVIFVERVRSDGERVVHLGGAIALDTGEIVSWWQDRGDGAVTVRWPQLPGENEPLAPLVLQRGEDEIPAAELRAGEGRLVAAVAGSKGRRNELHSRYDLDGANRWVATIGGNPCVLALLLGDLSALIEVRTVSLRDAAYLVAVKLAGGVVVDEAGNSIDVLDRFSELDRRERQIGPFIAAASHAHARAALRLQRRGEL